MLRKLASRSVILIAMAGAIAACGSVKKVIPVIGFQPAGASTVDIDQNSAVISSVGVDGLALSGAGSASAVNAAERTQLAAANSDGLKTQLLVTNIDKSGEFSEALAYKTLRSSREISQLARALSSDVLRGGWNGIMLDLEALQQRDAHGLVALTRKLRADIPKRDKVSVTLTNNTSMSAYRSEGYEPKSLASTDASLVLMAYDEHGPWEKTPGPIGALGWQISGIDVLRKVVAAKQIILAVAGYGYAWEKNSTVALGVDQARDMAANAGVKARWIPSVGEWTAQLDDGTTIWWSDSRSFAVRVKLARKLHLAGMAVWSLPATDPLKF